MLCRDRKIKQAGPLLPKERCWISIPAGSKLVILQPNSQVPLELLKSTSTISTGVQSTPVCSMHVMAAVALSELASGVSQPTVEKRNLSTQTETSTPDVWLNLVQEGAIVESNKVRNTYSFYLKASKY